MGRKITLDIIKPELALISPDIEVIDKEYKGCNKPLECFCKNCGKKWFPIWDNLKQGKGCMECKRNKGNEVRRMSISDVKKRAKVLSPRIEITANKYIDEEKEMDCSCLDCGRKFQLSWRSIRNGVGCKICTKENYFKKRRITTTYIEKYLTENNVPIVLLSKKYKNAHELLDFKCKDCNLKFKKTWTNIKTLKQFCPDCGIKKRSGINHPNYNRYLTDEERSKTRLLMYGKEYMKWCYEVHRNHYFSCKVCRAKKDIVAHHLYSYSTHVDMRLDVNNGVTLCRQHHKNFHKKYGYKNNTKEQFEEYLKHAQ